MLAQPAREGFKIPDAGHPSPALNLRMRPMNRAPDALWRGRQLDMFDAKLSKRVDDRIRDCGKAGRDAALASTAHSERVCGRRHLADFGLEQRQVIGARYGVIHQGRRQKLPRAGIVNALLRHRLTDPCAMPPWLWPWISIGFT